MTEEQPAVQAWTNKKFDDLALKDIVGQEGKLPKLTIFGERFHPGNVTRYYFPGGLLSCVAPPTVPDAVRDARVAAIKALVLK